MTHRIKTTDKQGNTEYHLITVSSANNVTLARAIARIAHASQHGVGFSTITASDWLLNSKSNNAPDLDRDLSWNSVLSKAAQS